MVHLAPTHQTGKAEGQQQMAPYSMHLKLPPMSRQPALNFRRTFQGFWWSYHLWLWCFHPNMKPIVSMAAIKHHKQFMYEARAFAAAKCVMEQQEWVSSQCQETRGATQVWSWRYKFNTETVLFKNGCSWERWLLWRELFNWNLSPPILEVGFLKEAGRCFFQH